MKITKYTNIYLNRYSKADYRNDQLFDTYEEAYQRVLSEKEDKDTDDDEYDWEEDAKYVKTLKIEIPNKKTVLTFFDPFNIEDALSGKTIVSKNGKRIKLIDFNGRKGFPIIGYVYNENIENDDPREIRLREWDLKGDGSEAWVENLAILPDSLIGIYKTKKRKTKRYTNIYERHGDYHNDELYESKFVAHAGAISLHESGFNFIKTIEIDLRKINENKKAKN